jgi:hypothetical protein
MAIINLVNETLHRIRVKVSGHWAENSASKVIGGIPALNGGRRKGEIKTQYTGSGSTMLKSPRVIEGGMSLTVPSGAVRPRLGQVLDTAYV